MKYLYVKKNCLLVYLIVPICYFLALKMNKTLFFTLCFSLFAIVMLDEIYNLVIARIISTPRASDIYKKLGIHYVSF